MVSDVPLLSLTEMRPEKSSQCNYSLNSNDLTSVLHMTSVLIHVIACLK